MFDYCGICWISWATPHTIISFNEYWSGILLNIAYRNYFVRTSYLDNNTVDGFDLTNTTALLQPLLVRGCEWVCPLENFIA